MIVHLNGKLMPLSEASISPLDRGFLFGDGLYEGLRSFDGRIVGLDLHVKRLAAGLREICLDWDAAALGPICEALARANNCPDAFFYLQVTRGVPAPGQPVRSRLMKGTVTPTVFAYCVPSPDLASYATIPTKSAVTVSDTRWHRGHVKSISLLGNVLANFEADERGAEDAIFVRDGIAGESTSANLILALPGPRGTQIVTPSLDSVSILAGVTRDILIDAMKGEMVARPVTAAELASASEVMLTGTLTMITSVTKLDGRAVGDGAPGPVAKKLMRLLVEAIREGR